MAPPDTDHAVRAGPRKREMVARLSELLAKATSTVVTDYRGLSVKQLEDLRARLRAESIEYVVVKNTLARRAASDAGAAGFAAVLKGPVGLAVGFGGDLSAPARILNDYHRATRQAPMVAGLVEGKVLDAASVRVLAELPSRDALLGRLAGTLQAPLTQLAGSLDSILTSLAATLDAYRGQLEAT